MKVAATIAVLAASFFALIDAACDNACSGHGDCNYKDACTCWQNWRMGDEDHGDCSDRQCPFELAWVDGPDAAGLHHRYAECAGRGICDRTTGECQCFDGYTGKGCQRTTCPNDCSGHGRCEYIEDMPYRTVWGDYNDGTTTAKKGFGDRPVTFSGDRYWDQHKTRGCVCDPRWTDVDCSRRMCPRGTDVLQHRSNDDSLKQQVQLLTFETATNWNKTIDYNVSSFTHTSFALQFTSTLNETYVTHPIKLSLVGTWVKLDAAIKEALLKLPHQVVDDVDVGIFFPDDDPTLDDLEDWENVAEWGGPNIKPVITKNFTVAITFTGDYVQGPQHLLSVVDYTCGDGCTPKLTGMPLSSVFDTRLQSFVAELTQSDYNNYECGRRGKCDYDSGLCQCFDGYTGEACGTQTALI